MLAYFFSADDNGIFFALQVLEVQVWTNLVTVLNLSRDSGKKEPIHCCFVPHQ